MGRFRRTKGEYMRIIGRDKGKQRKPGREIQKDEQGKILLAEINKELWGDRKNG